MAFPCSCSCQNMWEIERALKLTRGPCHLPELHCTYNCMSFLSEQCKNLKLCMHHKFINCACLVGVLIAKEDSITHVIGLTVLLDLHLSHRIIIFDNVFHLFVNFLMLSSFYLYKTLFLFEKQEKMTQCLKTIKKCLILNFRAKNRCS